MITKDIFANMTKYDTFEHWFTIDIAEDLIFVHSKSGETIANFNINCIKDDTERGCFGDLDFSMWLSDWKHFKHRPETYLYYMPTKFSDSEAMIDFYEKQLVASTMILAQESGKNPDTVTDGLMKCLDWLRTTDFYTCPASRQYHDNFHGGLLLHTMKVVSKCRELIKLPTFQSSVSCAKAIHACLVHDWCKIGLYEQYTKNVKDESTDSWNSVQSYRYKNDRAVCLGHGSSSMFLASKFFSLSYEEALAIRWHMGEFNVASSESQELSQACRMYPLVYLIQFADRLSCVDY